MKSLIFEEYQGQNIPGQHRTVCIVHKEIYDIIVNLPESEETNKVVKLLEEACEMGRRMSVKLDLIRKSRND